MYSSETSISVPNLRRYAASSAAAPAKAQHVPRLLLFERRLELRKAEDAIDNIGDCNRSARLNPAKPCRLEQRRIHQDSLRIGLQDR
jgi:hypothetical protein